VFDPQILHVAARQYGVFTMAQALSSCAVSRQTIGRARRRGVLVEVLPGVLRVASSPETFDMRCMAMQLRFEGEGYLGGRTAARRWGLRKMPASPIEFTVGGQQRRSGAAWAVMRRSDWFDLELDSTIADGLRVATPLRMLWGLAACCNQFRFERAAEDAWHLGLVTPWEAAEYLGANRCRGKNGVATMERWLERALAQGRPAQSELERTVLSALAEVGLPEPVRQYPLHLVSGEVIHLDIAWPAIRLAVEPGARWWHGGDLAQARDHARDRACQEVGWDVARFDESVRDSPLRAARQIERIYRRRERDLLRNPAAHDR
jgi:hypothetical protein